MNNKRTYNYEVHVCGEQREEEKDHQDFWLKGKLIVIDLFLPGYVLNAARRSLRLKLAATRR